MPGAPAKVFLLTIISLTSMALADGPIQLPFMPDSAPDPSAGPFLTPAAPPAPSFLTLPEDAPPPAAVRPDAAGALGILKAFLGASSYQKRLPFILHEETLRKIVQAYYTSTPDGPIEITSIQQLPTKPTKPNEPREFAFQVTGPGLEHPVPARVVQTNSGYKVDWLMFTEFKDDLLLKYASSYHANPARFHVVMHRSHYFEKDVPDLAQKNSFKLEPPIQSYSINVFVDKDTALARELNRTVTWGLPEIFVIAELRWHKKSGYEWIELAAVPQYNWDENPPKAVPVSRK